MDLQEKYDELDNIVSTLDMLIDDITDKYYIELLNEIKYEAQNEMDDIGDELQEECDKEYEERKNEYINSRL